MLVSGLLTCSMFYALIAPDAAVRSTFGQTIEGDAAQIVVRNWGALVGLMGILLIYGAFREHARRLVLLVAGTSKVVFIGLVLFFGPALLQFQLGISVAIDAVMVALFGAYLIFTRPLAS